MLFLFQFLALISFNALETVRGFIIKERFAVFLTTRKTIPPYQGRVWMFSSLRCLNYCPKKPSTAWGPLLA